MAERVRHRLSVDEQVELLEQRRKSSESLMWQLPSISIAAQAFLLSVGLAGDTRAWAQIAAGLLGLLVSLATPFVVAFQGVRVTALTRWLDNEIANPALSHPVGLNRAQRWLLRTLPSPLWPWVFVLMGFCIADLLAVCDGLGWI